MGEAGGGRGRAALPVGLLTNEHNAVVGRQCRPPPPAQYGAPEQLASGEYTAAVDLYPLGIILFELLHPMGTGMERALVFRDIRNGLLPPAFVSMWPTETSLVLALISHDPAKRSSAAELLAVDLLHPTPPSPAPPTSEPSGAATATATSSPPSPSAESASATVPGALAETLAAKDREILALRQQLLDQQLLLAMLQSE